MSPESKNTVPSSRFRRTYGLRRWRGPYPVILSVALGILIWGYIDARRMEVQEFEVQMQIDMPQGWDMIGLPNTENIKVHVRGPRQVIRGIRQNRPKIVQEIQIPDTAKDRYDPKIVLNQQKVEGLPNEVTIIAIEPSEIQLHFVRLIRKWVPIEPMLVGKPDLGYTIGLVQSDPKGVEVLASRDFIDKLTPSDNIKTEPVDVTGKRYGASDRVALQPLIKSGKEISVPGTVYVSVELVEIPSTRTLKEKIPVRILSGWPLEMGEKVILEPPAVQVTISGPELVVSKISSSDISIYVDTRERVPLGKGVFSLKCRSLSPEKIEVVRINPSEVRWKEKAEQPKPTEAGKPK